MTGDTWHMTHGHGVRRTFPQNVSSLAIPIWELRCCEDLKEKHQCASDWMNHEGVCRTALATPGRINIYNYKDGIYTSLYEVLALT